MRVGTQFVGCVDSIGAESIQTKFFLFGLPLFPLESYYCLTSGYNSVRGFPISLNRKSIIVAYLFWWLSFPLLIAGGLLFFVNKYDIQYLLLLILGIVIWFAVSRFARLSPSEKRCRTILKNIAGVAAPPDLLPEDMVQTTLLALEEQWKNKASVSLQKAWRDSALIEDLDLESLLLLFCLASYARESDLTSTILKRIETQDYRNSDNLLPS